MSRLSVADIIGSQPDDEASFQALKEETESWTRRKRATGNNVGEKSLIEDKEKRLQHGDNSTLETIARLIEPAVTLTTVSVSVRSTCPRSPAQHNTNPSQIISIPTSRSSSSSPLLPRPLQLHYFVTMAFSNWFSPSKSPTDPDAGSTSPKPAPIKLELIWTCLLYTSPSPRDGLLSRMPSSA